MMRRPAVRAIAAAVLLLVAAPSTSANPQGERRALAARHWVVQLQDANLQALGATAYDVIVIDCDLDNPWRPQRQVIAALDGFAAAGKAVLAMDYLTRTDKIDTFFTQATARGWAAYAAPDRDLARFATPAGHESGCAALPAPRR